MSEHSELQPSLFGDEPSLDGFFLNNGEFMLLLCLCYVIYRYCLVKLTSDGLFVLSRKLFKTDGPLGNNLMTVFKEEGFDPYSRSSRTHAQLNTKKIVYFS